MSLTPESRHSHSVFSFVILFLLGACLPGFSADSAAAKPRLFTRHAKPLPAELNAAAQSPAAATVAPRAGGLSIVPVFDSSINNNPRAADIKATINAAIAVYQATFSDNVTVNITFQDMNSGLGQSNTFIFTTSYSNFHSALTSHKTTVDDTTALAHLPSGTTNPANNGTDMDITTANARALGFNANPPAGQSDSTIGLNTSICNILSSDNDPNKYSLFATACHEIDEVLGLGSDLDGNNTAVTPEDLFRYDGNGARSYSKSSGATAWFSLDGTTNLVRFNQDSSGDFGDWYSPGGQTPRVQDAFGTPGTHEVLAEELIALDVIGWSRVGNGGGGNINLAPDTSVAFTVPPAAVTKSTMNISAAVKNTGTSASGSFVVRFAFSTDNVPSADDLKIGDVTIANVAAGASAPVAFSGPCPIVASTSYFVTMTIDPSNAVAETNENDNTAVSAGKVVVTGIQPPLIVSPANASPNPANGGQTVTFTVSATDPNASPLSYSWDFGDGSTDTSGPMVTHVYTAAGTYPVVVTVTDGLGGSAASAVSMQITTTVVQASALKKSFTLNFKTGSDKIDVTLFHTDFANIVDGAALTFFIGDAASGKGTSFDTATLLKKKGAGNLGKFTLNTRSSTLRYMASRVQLQALLAPFGATVGNLAGTVNVPLYIQVDNKLYGDVFAFAYSVRGTMGKGK